MTARFLIAPLVTALFLILLSWLLNRAPENTINGFRLFNGFAIVALLVWVVRRVLRYESALDHHRKDIIDLMQACERNRTEDVKSLMQQTAAIATELSMKANRKSVQQLEGLSKQINELDKKVNGTS